MPCLGISTGRYSWCSRSASCPEQGSERGWRWAPVSGRSAWRSAASCSSSRPPTASESCRSCWGARDRMTGPPMRRLAPLLSLVLLLIAAPGPSASAQEPTPVRLTLLSQTSWNSTSQRVVDLRFRAENLGDVPLPDLSIGVTLYSRVLTRSAYEQSLVTDPFVVIDAETLAREGPLEPAVVREFEVAFTLDSFGLDPDQSGVYPLEVALGAGGRLNGQIRALLELVSLPSDPVVEVALSPVLITQLGRMRGGYAVVGPEGIREIPAGEGGAQLAGQALEDLRTIASTPGIRMTAMPFATPELPALYGGGLGLDVGIQLERGRQVVGAFLQTTPVPGVLRPPGAALDDTTLRGIAALGITTLLVGPATVERVPQPLDLTGPATASLAEGSIAAIAPDPSTAAVIAQIAPDDPVRAAHAALGELAAIWQERPGDPRGVALVLGEDLPLPGPFFVTLARGVSGAPWLSLASPTELLAAFPPPEPSEVATPSLRRFTGTYIAELKQARRRVYTLSSMLPLGSDEPAQLETMLLLAEARQFLSEPGGGRAFINAVPGGGGAGLGSLPPDTVETRPPPSAAGG